MSDNEVRNVNKNVKNNKVTDHGRVANTMIKQLPCHFISHLFVTFNIALRLQNLLDI